MQKDPQRIPSPPSESLRAPALGPGRRPATPPWALGRPGISQRPEKTRHWDDEARHFSEAVSLSDRAPSRSPRPQEPSKIELGTVHTYIHVCTHTYIHTLRPRESPNSRVRGRTLVLRRRRTRWQARAREARVFSCARFRRRLGCVSGRDFVCDFVCGFVRRGEQNVHTRNPNVYIGDRDITGRINHRRHHRRDLDLEPPGCQPGF